MTGGATGIGRVCAEALLAAGARVLVASRQAENCEVAAKELSAIAPRAIVPVGGGISVAAPPPMFGGEE